MAALRTRSPAAAASSEPQSADGGASSRLREMQGRLAQQDSQLTGARAENQVGALYMLEQASLALVHPCQWFHAAPVWWVAAGCGRHQNWCCALLEEQPCLSWDECLRMRAQCDAMAVWSVLTQRSCFDADAAGGAGGAAEARR